MDSTTFSRELSKYKIVRLADHTRIRLKTIRVKRLHCTRGHRTYSFGFRFIYRLHLIDTSPPSEKRNFKIHYVLEPFQKPDSKPKLLNNSNANNAANKPLSLGVESEVIKSLAHYLQKLVAVSILPLALIEDSLSNRLIVRKHLGSQAEDFWNMMERVNANTLSSGDMKKLIAAMKEVTVFFSLIATDHLNY